MRRALAIVRASAVVPTVVAAEVPLTSAGNGHLVVPAFVNGKGTVPFILDTGADGSSVYQWFAKQQALRAGQGVSVMGMTGATVAPTYLIESIAVDRRTIRKVEASGLPDRKDAAITAGVVGNDLMEGSVATFDYPCSTVSLTPRPASTRRLLTPAAVLVKGGPVAEGTQLTLPVKMNGTVGTAILDTGSRGTQVNRLFARSAGIDVDGPGFQEGETLYGAASNAAEAREGKVRAVAFGKHFVADLTIRVVDLPVFESWGLDNTPAMILGMNALSGMRVLYDHERRHIWFDRSRCAPTTGPR